MNTTNPFDDAAQAQEDYGSMVESVEDRRVFDGITEEQVQQHIKDAVNFILEGENGSHCDRSGAFKIPTEIEW